MQCATIAAGRGHSVTLYEARNELGGMLVPGSRPAIKFDILNYLARLRRGVEETRGLSLKLGTSPSAAELKQAGYDVIVCATGSRQARPPVPGIDGANVHLAVDVLRDPALANAARKVVIVGGGVVGCETAYWLAHELRKDVTIVEMLPQFMQGVCTANRGWLIHYLEERGVRLLNCTRLSSVKAGAVTVRRNVSPSVPDPLVTWSPLLPENIENPFAPKLKLNEREETLEADLVILAAGARPEDSLYQACLAIGAAPDIRTIGDSFTLGRVLEATRAAYAVATAL